MKLLLPLLLTPLASLQRTRLVAASPASATETLLPQRDDGTEPDWRHAYLRLREEEQPASPVPGVMAHALPAPQAPEPEPAPARRIETMAPRGTPTALRHREEEQRPDPAPSAPTVLSPVPDAQDIAPVQATLLTPTAQRIVEAVRQITAPAPALTPVARVWQVELPSTGAAWQLRVEQVQPQAPLSVELHVPAVMQTQARQQLGDLDKRLREAGHDVLRSRLRMGKKRGPVDGVPS